MKTFKTKKKKDWTYFGSAQLDRFYLKIGHFKALSGVFKRYRLVHTICPVTVLEGRVEASVDPKVLTGL